MSPLTAVIPIQYRITAYMVIVAACLVIGYTRGVVETGRKWELQVARANQEALERQQKAIAHTDSVQAKLADLKYQAEIEHEQAQTKNDRLLDDNRRLAAALRMRKPRGEDCGSTLPQAAGAAGGHHQGTGDDQFSAELARLAVEMASAADRNTDQLILCQQHVVKQYEVMK